MNKEFWMQSVTVEIVHFRLKPGVDETAFLSVVDATQPPIAKLPGFLRRSVQRNAEGLWVDIVHWRSEAEALAAAAKFPTMPEMGEFVAMLDETDMAMYHLEQLRRFE
jgi:Antibiotic biosynthesis monooxygenase